MRVMRLDAGGSFVVYTTATLAFFLLGAALYFRYRRTPEELVPGRLWDLGLWISCLGLLVVSLKVIADKLTGVF